MKTDSGQGSGSEKAITCRPILFSGPMIRALLEGRKTQTRRIVKPQYACQRVTWGCRGGHGFGFFFSGHENDDDGVNGFIKCPYGQPGDRLWVKETHALGPHNAIAYRADGACGAIGGDGDGNLVFYKHGHILEVRPELGGRIFGLSKYGGKWKPSLFLRRDHTRITLEIVSVRVERVRDISEEDAKAEGVAMHLGGFWGVPGVHNEMECSPQHNFLMARAAFLDLFFNINERAPKDSNPWVWVIEFKVLQRAGG